MELKCYNQKCLWVWDYKGKATDDKDTLTCPKCAYKLKLGKARLGRLPSESKQKEYADYEDPRCKVTDKLGKEWVFPKPVLKEGENTNV